MRYLQYTTNVVNRDNGCTIALCLLNKNQGKTFERKIQGLKVICKRKGHETISSEHPDVIINRQLQWMEKAFNEGKFEIREEKE